MGYNTRRKSLSLTELGIVLPKRARTQSHPSPPNTIVEGDESDRPAKKSRMMSPPKPKDIKSQPTQLSPPPSPVAEGRNKVDVDGINDDIVIGTIQQLEQTGNRPHLVKELATVLATGLHSVEKFVRFADDIPVVDDVIRRNCANIITRSANPSALISSRLTAYLNRSWPAISPCPLAKDLSPIHPRRLYFFLTTTPRQPIPETVEPNSKTAVPRIISPSLSSASAADEDEEMASYLRTRQVMSPSPEVDLSSPDLDDEHAREPPTPGAPFSGRNSVARERSQSASNLPTHGRRGGSPQLEHEERDFKQTANALYEQAQQRRNSQQSQQQQQPQSQDEPMDGTSQATAGAEQEPSSTVAVSIEETDELTSLRHNSEDASALFGGTGEGLGLLAVQEEEHGLEIGMFSSPLIQPQAAPQLVASSSSMSKLGQDVMHLDLDVSRRDELAALSAGEWEVALQSPENVGVDELEDMFDAY